MSKRVYEVVGFEQPAGSLNFTFKLEELFSLGKNPTEVMITLSEKIDGILDLQVEETLYVQLTRDNRNDKGVIKRIN